MLDILRADDFNSLIGETFTIVITNGPDLDVTLEQVKENPQGKNPNAGDDVRTPFSLFFKAGTDLTIENGTFDIRHEKFPDDIQNVSITRVIPAESETPEAWYQVIFC